jgi:transcriptional regulator with XRE-family HTH domain
LEYVGVHPPSTLRKASRANLRHMPDRHRRRAGTARLRGRERGRYLARRIGVGLKESRVALDLTQSQASERAGVSQGFGSRLERGGGSTASIETLAACAAAVDGQLAAFIEAAPGADLPRDIAHLRGQSAIVRFAKPGGWRARAEVPIDPDARRSRSIDVLLERDGGREIAVVELVDLIKVAVVRRAAPTATVAGLLAVRATRRNRALIGELWPVIEARLPGRSADWIAALQDPDRPMPLHDGLVWARVDGSGLFARRSSAR